jgi:hypothetical protein
MTDKVIPAKVEIQLMPELIEKLQAVKLTLKD